VLPNIYSGIFDNPYGWNVTKSLTLPNFFLQIIKCRFWIPKAKGRNSQPLHLNSLKLFHVLRSQLIIPRYIITDLTPWSSQLHHFTFKTLSKPNTTLNVEHLNKSPSAKELKSTLP
jgi:hypothetical protein